MPKKAKKQAVSTQYFEPLYFFEDQKSQFPWSAFRTNLQGN